MREAVAHLQASLGMAGNPPAIFARRRPCLLPCPLQRVRRIAVFIRQIICDLNPHFLKL
jgi:hypothetical protein